MTRQGGTTGTLTAVVVTHNRLPQLQITLARLLGSAPEYLIAVVVVNNASTDDTETWLAGQTDPRLVVLTNDTNLGGAGGFERGMREAVLRFDPDWLVVMDDDARPEPDALARFHALDLSRWDAVAAAVYFPSGEICEMNRPSRNPFWHISEFFGALRRGRGGFHLKSDAYAAREGRPIDVTSFVGFFVSRRAIEMVGYPDPGLFLYADDGIYTLELSARGGRIGFEPTVRFEHALSTFAGQRGRFRPLWKVYYYHRNLMLLYRLAAGWMFWPALLVIIPKWLWKTLDHRGESKTFLGLMLRAIRDGLLKRTDVPHGQVVEWGRADPIPVRASGRRLPKTRLRNQNRKSS